jgi:hypothetical protein
MHDLSVDKYIKIFSGRSKAISKRRKSILGFVPLRLPGFRSLPFEQLIVLCIINLVDFFFVSGKSVGAEHQDSMASSCFSL